MWHFLAENWKVLVFLLIIVLSAVIYGAGGLYGAISGNDDAEVDIADTSRFLLVTALAGLAAYFPTGSLLCGLFGGAIVAALVNAAVRRWRRTHRSTRTIH